MTTQLMVQPPFRDDWTNVTLDGEHEDEVLNILSSRLLAADYAILIEAEDGEMIPLEEHEDGQS